MQPAIWLFKDRCRMHSLGIISGTGSTMDNREESRRGNPEELEVLEIHVRPDLYRAFRRCVWMTVHETGLPIVDIHNMLIEELLKQRGC